MKAKAVSYLLLLGVTAGVMSCSNDDDDLATPGLESSQIVLVNDTSGTAVNAGLAKINELSDGNISMEVSLADSFRTSEANYPAAIVKFDTTLQRDSVYADLGIIAGATGTVTKTPVVWGPTNEPISYDSLMSLSGFRVKISADTLVQAEGSLN